MAPALGVDGAVSGAGVEGAGVVVGGLFVAVLSVFELDPPQPAMTASDSAREMSARAARRSGVEGVEGAGFIRIGC